MDSSKNLFTGNDKGLTIAELLERLNSLWPKGWKVFVVTHFKDEAATWWESLNKVKCLNLPDEKFEKLLFDKWFHVGKQDNEKHVGLFYIGISLLQVHGCIQKDKIIVSINPSCKKIFINFNLENRLQVPAKQMEHTKVDNEHVQVYKDLKISVENYVLHSNFYASDMANVDVFLGYPWMESISTININMQKEFMKLWYKKKKIKLEDISINKQVDSKEVEAKIILGSDTLDDEYMVELILEDKKQLQAPQHILDTNWDPLGGELKKYAPLVKTLAYHHPHHLARKEPTRWKQIIYKDNNPHMTDREMQRSNHNTSTQRNHQNQLPSQASEAPDRLSNHLSIGCLCACAWYQWPTLLSRSNYLCSSNVSRTKHV